MAGVPFVPQALSTSASVGNTRFIFFPSPVVHGLLLCLDLSHTFGVVAASLVGLPPVFQFGINQRLLGGFEVSAGLGVVPCFKEQQHPKGRRNDEPNKAPHS